MRTHPSELGEPGTSPSGVTITWLRQAGFLVEGRAGAVLFDAFLTDLPGMLVPPGATPEEVSWVTAVLASHEHADHLDGRAFGRIAAASEVPVFIVPRPLCAMAIEAGVPKARVIGAQPGSVIKLGALRIHPVPARHGIHMDDAYTFGHELSDGDYRYLGYVVELDGVRIYHAGDTIAYDGMVERLRALNVDVALLPINGRDHFRERDDVVGNLTPREAADLAAAIGVDLVIPMHYDTVPGNTESPGIFIDYLRRTHPRVSAHVPGESARFVYVRPDAR